MMTHSISTVDVFDVLQFWRCKQANKLILRAHCEDWLQTNQTLRYTIFT